MKRKITIALVSVLVLTFLARVSVSGVASSRFRAYDARWTAEVAAERARAAALVRPVVAGAPIEDDAAPRYRKVVSVDDLVLAVHCTRCDWKAPYETALFEPLPDDVGLEKLAARLVDAGKERARVGDAGGAADRYLEAARFGTDLELSGLTGAPPGMHVEALALAALLDLASKGAVDRPRIAAALAHLEAARPSPAALVRQYRLGFRSIAAFAASRETKGTEDERAGLIVVPPRATSELAAVELDAFGLELEKAVAIDDPVERKNALDAIQERIGASWNPETRLWGAGLADVRERWDECRTGYAAVAASLR